MRISNGTLERALLWLLVLNLGVVFGAGLYEHRVVLPGWVGADEQGMLVFRASAMSADNPGLRFWVFTSTAPLTLLALGNLAAVWRCRRPERRVWLGVCLVVLLERALTFSYFIPTIVALEAAGDSAASVSAALRWMQLNLLRHALTAAAWVGSLWTLIQAYQPAGDVSA